jgi:hypothetical protein
MDQINRALFPDRPVSSIDHFHGFFAIQAGCPRHPVLQDATDKIPVLG